MSTVKISQLPTLSQLAHDTANTLLVGVDVPSSITGKLTATTLAAGLYTHNQLNVGNNDIIFTNTSAQFSGSDPSFLQVNLQNFNSNGAVDLILTADTGTNSNSYIDLGINNSKWNPITYGQTSQKPYDGYLVVNGPGPSNVGNLVIGTATTGTNIVFAVGGYTSSNVVGTISQYEWSPKVNVKVTGTISSTLPYIFADGSTQNTAVDKAFVQATANKANTALQNTSGVFAGSLTVTGNIIANTANTSVSLDKITSNNATFSNNVTITGTLYANTAFGNVFFSNVSTTTSQSNSILWFPQSTKPTQASGQVWYSSNTISLVQDTDIAGDRPSISKVLFERVYNSTGSIIPQNSVVRLSGAVTSNSIPYIQLSDATSYANATVLGIVKVPIANNAYGFVYLTGIIEDMNTSSYNTGDILYLSPTPGLLQNTIPYGTNTVVQIAKVLNNSSTNGVLQLSTTERPALGKANGAIMYSNNNTLVSSNTFLINDSTKSLSMNASIFMTGEIRMNNSTFASNTAAVRINGSTGYAYQTPINDGYMLHVTGKDNIPTRIVLDSSSVTGNAYGLLAGRTSRGTATSPSHTQSGDVLLRLSGNGYGNTGFSSLGVTRIDFVASENYTDNTKGSHISFGVVPVGSNTITSNVVVINTNTVSFANTITPANGVIHTVRSYPGAQTAITINMTTDTWVYANSTAAVAVTPTGFKSGKETLVILTNSSTGGGSTHTITHGLASTNSSTGTTTFLLTGGVTAFLRYYSLNSDIANTYVAITYS